MGKSRKLSLLTKKESIANVRGHNWGSHCLLQRSWSRPRPHLGKQSDAFVYSEPATLVNFVSWAPSGPMTQPRVVRQSSPAMQSTETCQNQMPSLFPPRQTPF